MQKKNYRPESDCGNYPDHYQYSEKPHYDNPPYNRADPKKHKWPRKLLISYLIDWAIVLSGLAALCYSIWWAVNH